MSYMSESNIIFSTNSFDTSVNIHNMSPIKKTTASSSTFFRSPSSCGERGPFHTATHYELPMIQA